MILLRIFNASLISKRQKIFSSAIMESFLFELSLAQYRVKKAFLLEMNIESKL